jgi:hypothetical protein
MFRENLDFLNSGISVRPLDLSENKIKNAVAWFSKMT